MHACCPAVQPSWRSPLQFAAPHSVQALWHACMYSSPALFLPGPGKSGTGWPEGACKNTSLGRRPQGAGCLQHMRSAYALLPLRRRLRRRLLRLACLAPSAFVLVQRVAQCRAALLHSRAVQLGERTQRALQVLQHLLTRKTTYRQIRPSLSQAKVATGRTGTAQSHRSVMIQGASAQALSCLYMQPCEALQGGRPGDGSGIAK